MFQMGMDDEPPDGMAAALLGSNGVTGVPVSGLGATLMPNVGITDTGQGDTAGGQNAATDNAGSTTPAEQAPTADPAGDSGGGEWGKMLAQLYEAGRFRSGYLGKIFGSVDYANLAEGTMNTSMEEGLGDIQFFEDVGDHSPYIQLSLINWRLVDWSKYGADEHLAPETVMRNFLQSAMASGN